jgi:hypothetical protein
MTESIDPLDDSALDFWLGDWDVSWGPGGGRNRLTRVVGGRGVLERFDGRGPRGSLHGMSLSVRDTSDGRWRQTWIDSTGGYLALEGVEVDGRIGFQLEALEEGVLVQRRMIWTDVRPDSMVWRWQSSKDAGATWTDDWRIDYTRRPSGTPAARPRAAAARGTPRSAR